MINSNKLMLKIAQVIILVTLSVLIILMWKYWMHDKSHENIIIYNVAYKTLYVAKPLLWLY